MPNLDDDQRLTSAFAEFRDGVAPYVMPAGTAAVRETVRHRRRVGVAAAILGVLVITAPAIALAAVGDNQDPPPPHVATTGQDTPAPTTPQPTTAGPTTPRPTAVPSSPAATRPTGGTTNLPPVPGKAFYLDRSGALYLDGRKYPGGEVLSVNVSPDGKHITWVDQLSLGNLIMSDLDGANRRTVHWKVDGSCVEPVWSADSTRLLIGQQNQGTEVAILYLTGGAGDHLGAFHGCHYRWSADGKRIAYIQGDLSSVTLTNLDGSQKQTVRSDDLRGGRSITDLTAISADGGRICVHTVAKGEPVGDVARNLYCDTILDVATRKEVKLPIAGTLRTAVFQPDGGMLARVETTDGFELVLLDAEDRVIARTVETTATARLALLSYTPDSATAKN